MPKYFIADKFLDHLICCIAKNRTISYQKLYALIFQVTTLRICNIPSQLNYKLVIWSHLWFTGKYLFNSSNNYIQVIQNKQLYIYKEGILKHLILGSNYLKYKRKPVRSLSVMVQMTSYNNQDSNSDTWQWFMTIATATCSLECQTSAYHLLPFLSWQG